MSNRVHRGPPPEGAREIPGFEGRYFATVDGRIWSYFSQKCLAPAPNKNGYLVVAPTLNGRNVSRLVNRLVCAAFHGIPDPGMEANHRDLVKTNNAPTNLEWATPRQNTEHAWANLPAETIARMRQRRSAGAVTSNRQRRKLSQEGTARARQMLANEMSVRSVAAALQVGPSTIYKLASGETYRD